MAIAVVDVLKKSLLKKHDQLQMSDINWAQTETVNSPVNKKLNLMLAAWLSPFIFT